jgi:hypothetical protein
MTALVTATLVVVVAGGTGAAAVYRRLAALRPAVVPARRRPR